MCGRATSWFRQVAKAGRQFVKRKEEEQALDSAVRYSFTIELNKKKDEADADNSLLPYIFVLLDYTSASYFSTIWSN